MAIADTYLDLVQGFEKSKAVHKPHTSLFGRFFAALKASRQAQAEREILRHLRMTNDILDRDDGPKALKADHLPF